MTENGNVIRMPQSDGQVVMEFLTKWLKGCIGATVSQGAYTRKGEPLITVAFVRERPSGKGYDAEIRYLIAAKLIEAMREGLDVEACIARAALCDEAR